MKIFTDEEISKKLNKKNTRRKIINFIIYPIISILFICSLLLVIQVIRNPGKTANLFGYKFFNAISGSMEPVLNIGDIIIIKEVKSDDIQNGDIITFRDGKGVITHRIIDIIEEDGKIFYQTKGDNNNSIDTNLIQYKDIEGKYAYKIPKLGIFISKIQNPTTSIVIIIILYLLYKVLQIKDDRKIARHEKRNEIENKK